MKFNFSLIFILLVAPYGFGLASEAQTPTTKNSSFTASAKIGDFLITSDDLERDNETDIISLSGNVKVIYKTQFFEADFIELNLKRKQAHLKGNVKIQSTTHQIGGIEVLLDYESSQALIYYGYVQSNNVRFQGDLIEKQNDTEFYVDNADYTTCSNCPATWSFEGTKIKAELGGYAFIKNSLLRVGGVPFFWLPYLVVPLKSERQTGLLTPEIGFIRNRRLVVTQSLFWAISRGQDATITLKNYELGGLKPLVEHRYALNDYSRGITKFAYFNDKVFTSEDRYKKYLSATEQSKRFDRWALNSLHQYSNDNYNRFRVQLMLASDLQYPKDFYDEFTNYSDSSLENKVSYTHSMEHSAFTAEVAYNRNLLQANPLSSNEFAVHRAPEIHFDSTMQQIADLPLYFTFDSNFTRFTRDKKYDDISTASDQKFVSNNYSNPACENTGVADCIATADGLFVEGTDIIRTGNRFLAKATLNTATFNLGNFMNVSPKISINQASYIFPVGEKKTAFRYFPQFELNTRTKFFNIYDSDYDTTGLKYKNEIIPEIRYSSIPWIQQDNHPFFGLTNTPESPYFSSSVVSDSDLNTAGGILYDYEDRVYDRHILSFSVLNRLVRKKQADNSYKTVLDARVTQSYDLYKAERGATQPLSDLVGTLLVSFDQVTSYTQINYSPHLLGTNTLTSLSYLNEHQQYFKIGLLSNRTQDPKQDDVSFSIGFVSNYINVLTGIIYDASPDRDNSARLKKFSLITQLKPPGECWTVNFYHDQKVGLEPEWKIKFDFSFDGKPTKVIPPDELNISL
ncbi:MAG: LPS assembly protein LptD [Bdellovibrionota bacterium]